MCCQKNDCNTAPLLTIITVCKNDVLRLNKTVSSVFAFYDDPRFEHVVIDGGSHDSTHRLLTDLSVYLNFKFQSSADKGIFDGMNKGMRLAAGRFILFLNCGDTMVATPDQLASILENVHIFGNHTLFCFSYISERQGNKKLFSIRGLSRNKLPTSHQAIIFSRKVFDVHQFDTRFKYAADYDLYLKIDGDNIWLGTEHEPITMVEAVGFASQNTAGSYLEYLRAIKMNYVGFTRIFLMIKVLAKFLTILFLKSFLTTESFMKLREKVL